MRRASMHLRELHALRELPLDELLGAARVVVQLRRLAEADGRRRRRHRHGLVALQSKTKGII